MADKTMKHLVDTFFEIQDHVEAPPELAACDPVKLAKAIISRYSPWPHPNPAIMNLSDATSNRPIVIDYLRKFDEARKTLNGKELDQLLESFVFAHDLPFSRGHSWVVTTDPKGGIAILDKNEVYRISSNPLSSWAIPNKKLRAIAERTFNKFLNSKVVAPTQSEFSILHNTVKGIKWTQKIPDELSSTGQTIFILSTEFIEHWPKADVFGRSLLLQSIHKSETHHVVIRVFEDRAFVYTLETSGVNLGAYLENHSITLGIKPDEKPAKMVKVKSYSEEDMHRYVGIDYQFAHNGFPEIQRLISPNFYAIIYQKALQYTVLNWMSSFEGWPHFFTSDFTPEGTFSEYNKIVSLWKKGQKNIVVLRNHLSTFGAVRNLNNKIQNHISRVLREIEPVSVGVFIGPDQFSEPTSEIQFFHPESSDLKSCISRICVGLKFEVRRLFNYEQELRDKAEIEKDLLENSMSYLHLFILTKNDPDPCKIQKSIYNISKSNRSKNWAYVPKYGYSQLIDNGEITISEKSFIAPEKPWQKL